MKINYEVNSTTLKPLWGFVSDIVPDLSNNVMVSLSKVSVPLWTETILEQYVIFPGRVYLIEWR